MTDVPHGLSERDSAEIPDPHRRTFVGSLLVGAIAIPFTAPLLAATGVNAIEVWTGPSCSCCQDWVKHLRANGFDVTSHDGGNSEARKRLGLPARYGSCHTAETDGFAIEGHVPAAEIRRLLDERPNAIGLSVPAMPRGSPGMDGPAYDGVHDPYDVLLIGHDGTAEVYRSYP
ncbi:MAG: DUF411 domain-containing protein [Woeseia sp.]